MKRDLGEVIIINPMKYPNKRPKFFYKAYVKYFVLSDRIDSSSLAFFLVYLILL